jgi:hypothetical protein
MFGATQGVNRIIADECSADRPMSSIHDSHERLVQRIEQNSMLIERLRERLGAVSRPTGPRACSQPEPKLAVEGSPVAQALGQLDKRVLDINQGLEFLLADLDL